MEGGNRHVSSPVQLTPGSEIVVVDARAFCPLSVGAIREQASSQMIGVLDGRGYHEVAGDSNNAHPSLT